VREVPFEAMYAADSAVMALQGNGATDADKTWSAVRAAAPGIEADCLARARAALQSIICEHVPCSCVWDLDEEHPDFEVEGAEEPLKVVRPDPDCPQHMAFDKLGVERQ